MSILRYKQKLLPLGNPMGRGGGGGAPAPSPTTSTAYQTNLPEYARPYVETMLGAAQKQAYTFDDSGNITGFRPYVPYGATVDASGNITNTAQQQAQAAIAGFSPMQEQAFRQVAQMQVPGQYGVGSMFAGTGGMGAANLAQQAAMAQPQYFQMATSPLATRAFMSPYMQEAVNRQKFEAMRDYDIGLAKQRQQAVGAGAFGGSRMAIQEAEANRNLQQQLQNIQAAGTQRAFEQAQQAQQFGANLGLQGIGAALQGTGQLTAAGRTLADIGGAQLQAEKGIIGLQSEAGSQQQALEQARINQAMQNYALMQQYPQMQLSMMSSLLRGLPLQQATTQQYQAAPSALSQIGGLGAASMGLYGMGRQAGFFKEGGEVKLAKGGITGLSKRVLMNPEDFSTQQIDSMTKRGMISQLVGLPVLDAKMKDEQRMKMTQAAQQPKPADTIAAEIMARAAAAQGIDSAESNLPVMSAFDGGIVAMAEGGETPSTAPTQPTMSIAPPKGYTLDQASGQYEPEMPQRREGLGGIADMLFRNDGILARIIGRRGYAEGGEVERYQAGGTMAGFDMGDQGFDLAASEELDERRRQRGLAAVPTPPKPGLPKPRILPDEPRPTAGTAPAAAAPSVDVSGRGIADILKRYEETLGKGEARDKEAKKEAFWSSLAEFGFGAMAGTSPFAATNIGLAGGPAVKSGMAALRDIRSREEKRELARAQLGLEGEKLKADYAKLGIQEPYLRAMAEYYQRRPAPGAGRGLAGLGSVPFGEYRKLKDKYEGYTTDAKTALASPLARFLDKDTLNALRTKPGSPSYERGMEAVRRIANQRMRQDLMEGMQFAARQSVSPVETE